MIKFVSTMMNGKSLVGLGLSDKNLELLKKGMPISFEGTSLGFRQTNFLIFHGESEAVMLSQLKKAGVKFPEENTKGKNSENEKTEKTESR